MTSILRRQVFAIAMIAICGLFATVPAVAQEGTPAASPVATLPGHPAHIHLGTCDALADVVYELNAVSPGSGQTTAAIPVELSVTRINASLETILAQPHAINIHESEENIGSYIACGNIAGTPSHGDLFVGLGELNGLGYSGIAWLHDNGDGSTTVSLFLAQNLNGGGVAIPGTTPAASPVA